MSDGNTTTIQIGPGICGSLFLVFLVLKLVGVIAWSWWWVTSPLWLPWVAILGFLAVLIVSACIGAVIIATLDKVFK